MALDTKYPTLTAYGAVKVGHPVLLAGFAGGGEKRILRFAQDDNSIQSRSFASLSASLRMTTQFRVGKNQAARRWLFFLLSTR
jgi:hypothetical protein